MFERGDIERAVGTRPAFLSSDDAPRASVAAVFSESPRGGTRLLFIERARQEGDPWSGHLAFPGGRVDVGDADTRVTALRETWEEIGLDLRRHGTWIGQLDDLEGPTPNRLITVSNHAWWLHSPDVVLDLNYEVEDAFWVDMKQFVDPDNHFDYSYPLRPGFDYPAVDLEGRVLWGLTLRLIDKLFDRLGHPLPVRPG